MPAPQQMRRADSPGLMEGLQSPGHSSRTGACGLAKESVNYIYAGVCLSMVIAVIVLAVLLGQATFSLHHGAPPSAPLSRAPPTTPTFAASRACNRLARRCVS